MTPLQNLVKGQLLPVCLEATTAERERLPKTDKKPTKQEKALKALLKDRAGVISGDYLKFIADAIAIVMDNPNYKMQTDNPELASFCVICPVKDTVSHVCPLEEPIIVTHGRNRYALSQRGVQINYGEFKDIRIATDEEVEKCMDNLTDKQLQYILRESLFAPAMAALFSQQTELVVASGDGES